MGIRPRIFISAVSKELASARQLVANTLQMLGYEPVWQDVLGTQDGDVRDMLKRQIDTCDGVVQLVGKCYGVEPPAPDEQFGRVSYTQYEALYGRARGKKVWYLLLEDMFPADAHADESAEHVELQSKYREQIRSQTHLFHPLNSREALEARILKMRDEMSRMRRGVRRWALATTALLVISIAIAIWQIHRQHQSDLVVQQNNEQLAKMQQAVLILAQTKSEQQQPNEDPVAAESRTYAELARKLGVDEKLLREKLPQIAKELQQSPNATTYDRANAAYVSKDFAESGRLALQAAHEAQTATPAKPADAIRAFELAASSAAETVDFADAARYLREADKLTDRQHDPLECATVQYELARMLSKNTPTAEAESAARNALQERESRLGATDGATIQARNLLASILRAAGKSDQAEKEYRAILAIPEDKLGADHLDLLPVRNNLAIALGDQGKFAEAEKENRAVLTARIRQLGPENQDMLVSRNNLASVLHRQGKLAEAEAEYRSVLAVDQRVLGPEHPETLAAQSNVSAVLQNEGNFVEAEKTCRAVLEIKERVLGPDHPDTLSERDNLAVILQQQNKNADAEQEYRTVLAIQTRVIGAEHPDTLATRSNLAALLTQENKPADAEKEHRAILAIRLRTLGPDNPDTLTSRSNIANALFAEGKLADAETEYRAVITDRQRLLGADHPSTLLTCYNLTLCLWNEKKTADAKQLALQTLDGYTKTFGADDPQTKSVGELVKELGKATQ